MVALAHFVCIIFLWWELLMFLPHFSLWCFLCLLETGQWHRNFERSIFLLCCQLPTDLYNTNVVYDVWACGICSSQTFVERCGLLPSTQFAYRKMSVYLWCTYVCDPCIHCKVRWRVSRSMGLCRLTSAQPLIKSTIKEFSYKLCSVFIWGSVLPILTQLFSNRPHHVMVDGCRIVNLLTLCPEFGRAGFWDRYSTYLFTSELFLDSICSSYPTHLSTSSYF